jgi:hypothetical protein
MFSLSVNDAKVIMHFWMWEGNSRSQDNMYILDESGDLFNVTSLILEHKTGKSHIQTIGPVMLQRKTYLVLGQVSILSQPNQLKFLHTQLTQWPYYILQTMISFKHLGENFTVQRVTDCRATTITDKNTCFILFASPYAMHTNILLWEVLFLIVSTCTTYFLRHLHWGHY